MVKSKRTINRNQVRDSKSRSFITAEKNKIKRRKKMAEPLNFYSLTKRTKNDTQRSQQQDTHTPYECLI